MASNEKKAASEVVKETSVARARTNESVYTAEELAKQHKVFKTSYEIVTVALRLAGKKEATFSEAKTIIDNFKNREVK